jgi:hypothetical protein
MVTNNQAGANNERRDRNTRFSGSDKEWRDWNLRHKFRFPFGAT